MIKEQYKQLLIGAAVAGAAKFALHKDWKTSLVFGAAAIVALALYDSFNGVVSE
jgi:hypothetical protein